jgi:hypothetical protein
MPIFNQTFNLPTSQEKTYFFLDIKIKWDHYFFREAQTESSQDLGLLWSIPPHDELFRPSFSVRPKIRPKSIIERGSVAIYKADERALVLSSSLSEPRPCSAVNAQEVSDETDTNGDNRRG